MLLLALTSLRPLLVVGLIVYGIGKGLYDCNIMPVLAQVAPPELRSTGYGVFNFMGCLAGGLMAPLAGWMKSRIGIEGAFVAGAGMLLGGLAAVLSTRIPREKQW